MKRAVVCALLLLAAAGVSRCGSTTVATSPTGVVVVIGDLARGTGTVRWYSFEGGFFAIRGDDGVTYDPRNLPVAFQRDDVRVRFECRILNMGGIHMAGPIVDLISISTY